MIIREHYLQILRELRDLNLIKVVTGVRRSGKSTIFEQFIEDLKNTGVNPENIFHYNLEDPENDKYLDPDNKFALYNEIVAKADQNAKNYVFLDEVQNIPEFERTVDGLFTKSNFDVYITGSNSYITSGELATFLSGRYIEIKVQPLVFSEFVDFLPETMPTNEKFSLFVKYGGFPEVANMLASGAQDQIPAYLHTIYETVIEKDIRQHKKIYQIDDFEKVVKFAFDNYGNSLSASNISNVLKQENCTVDDEAVSRYLRALADCYILYETSRYDIRGRKLLRTQKKYYAVDVGLADTILSRPTTSDIGRRLENIVYLELSKRYADVKIGYNYGKEIDFVAKDANNDMEYFQVSQTVADESTLARELEAVKNTGDNHKKTLLTLDLLETDEAGIEKKNIVDWLLNE